jgi:hypothetical protein
LAHAVADVLPEGFRCGFPSGGTDFFFYGFDAAHFDASSTLGFVRAKAAANFFLGGGLLEGEQLFVHVAASLLFMEECFDPADEIFEEWHGGSVRLRG